LGNKKIFFYTFGENLNSLKTNRMKNPLPENTNQLTPTNITGVEGKISDVGTGIEPLVVEISPEDKKNYSIGGQKKEGMISKAVEVIGDHPEIVPDSFDKTKFSLFIGNRDLMSHFGDRLQELTNKCYDSATVYNIHASDMANTIYGYVQMAAQHDASLRDDAKELGKYFQKGPRIAPADFSVQTGNNIEVNNVVPGKLITNTGTSRLSLMAGPSLSNRVKRVAALFIEPGTAIKVPDGYTSILITNIGSDPGSFTIKLKSIPK